MIRTMVVEDEKLTRRYLMSLIPKTNHAFQVTTFGENGEDALRQMEKTPVDLVITDIRMPLMDGMELCEQIRRKYPQVMLVLLSGFGEFEYARKAIQSGVMAYLLKPIMEKDLEEVLKQAEEQWKSLEKQKEHEMAHRELQERTRDILTADFIRACALGRDYEKAYCRTQMNQMDIPCSIFPLLYFKLYMPGTEEGNPEEWLSVLYQKFTAEKIMGIRGCVFSDETDSIVIAFSFRQEQQLAAFIADMYRKLNEICRGRLTDGNLAGVLVRSVKDLEEADNWCEAARLLRGMHQIFLTEYGKKEWQFADGRFHVLSKENALKVLEIQKMAAQARSALENRRQEMYKQSMEHLRECFLSLFPRMSEEQYLHYIQKYIFSNEEYVHFPGGNTNLSIEKNPAVKKALDYIRANYCEPISLEIIAEKAGVSGSYMSNIFHKCTGESYSNYLNRLRMEEAAELLLQNQQLRLADISEQVGYVNIRHFLKVFKNYYGMTPTEYKSVYGRK